jgi:hypothetical protein
MKNNWENRIIKEIKDRAWNETNDNSSKEKILF